MNYRSEARERHEDERYDTGTAGLVGAILIAGVAIAAVIFWAVAS